MKKVDAASSIIIDDKGKVFLARRSLSKKSMPGLWETVGGSLESGEMAKECIRREIKEELGT